jgi:hypothetical protein
MATEFTTPEFLRGQSADVIHRRMLAALPNDMDKSELQPPWDLTRPTALEKAEHIENRLVEVIKLINPAWAYGVWLNYHAEARGMSRRAATPASGKIVLSGINGTLVPAGFKVSTIADYGAAGTEYQTTEQTEIQDGAAEADIVATVPGRERPAGDNRAHGAADGRRHGAHQSGGPVRRNGNGKRRKPESAYSGV